MFSESDNEMMLEPPTKKEVKDTIDNSTEATIDESNEDTIENTAN